jgi:hypothetical protein
MSPGGCVSNLEFNLSRIWSASEKHHVGCKRASGAIGSAHTRELSDPIYEKNQRTWIIPTTRLMKMRIRIAELGSLKNWARQYANGIWCNTYATQIVM